MNLFRFARRSRTAPSTTRRSSGVSFLQPKANFWFQSCRTNRMHYAVPGGLPANRTLPFRYCRVGDNSRINDSKALLDLQLILEKAGTPDQLRIATSSMMGGFWS